MSDPLYDQVHTLLHMEGTNGDTTFVDNAPTPLVWTANGNAQLSNTYSEFGTTSLSLDGAGDYLQQGAVADWVFAHSDVCTFEAQYYSNGPLDQGCLFDTGGLASANIGVSFVIYADGHLRLMVAKGVNGELALDLNTAAGVISQDTGHALAYCIDPQTTGAARIFADGVVVASGTLNGYSTGNPTQAGRIGNSTVSGSFALRCLTSEIRITKAVRYTTNYTPQTAPFPDSGVTPDTITPDSLSHLQYLDNVTLNPGVEIDVEITQQPQDQIAEVGGGVTFTVEAVNTSQYQWYRVGEGALAGETSSTLSFTAGRADHGSQYYVIVGGSIQSQTVALFVNDPTGTNEEVETTEVEKECPPMRPYKANIATPQDIEAMRFWVQQELKEIERVFSTVNDFLECLNEKAEEAEGLIEDCCLPICATEEYPIDSPGTPGTPPGYQCDALEVAITELSPLYWWKLQNVTQQDLATLPSEVNSPRYDANTETPKTYIPNAPFPAGNTFEYCDATQGVRLNEDNFVQRPNLWDQGDKGITGSSFVGLVWPSDIKLMTASEAIILGVRLFYDGSGSPQTYFESGMINTSNTEAAWAPRVRNGFGAGGTPINPSADDQPSLVILNLNITEDPSGPTYGTPAVKFDLELIVHNKANSYTSTDNDIYMETSAAGGVTMPKDGTYGAVSGSLHQINLYADAVFFNRPLTETEITNLKNAYEQNTTDFMGTPGTEPTDPPITDYEERPVEPLDGQILKWNAEKQCWEYAYECCDNLEEGDIFPWPICDDPSGSGTPEIPQTGDVLQWNGTCFALANFVLEETDIINDSRTALDTTWSSSKIQQMLAGKANQSDFSRHVLGSLDTFVAAGYGSVNISTPTAMSDINATWQRLPFNAAALANPRGITYDLPNNAMLVNFEGIWLLSLSVTLSFAEAQQGRSMLLRLWNVDAAAGTDPIETFVGRNTAGHTISFTVSIETDPATIGDTFVVEVSSAADTFTTVTAQSGAWSLTHVSEYKGTF